MRIAPQTQQQIDERARRLKETDPLRQALTDIATMPAYDQDDAHRLRHLAKRALDKNPVQSVADSEIARNADSGLLEAVKLAYRKHHLDDPDIGWNQLANKLCNALCNAMGDDGFQKWLASTQNADC